LERDPGRGWSDWRRWVARAGLTDESRGSDIAVSFFGPPIAWGSEVKAGGRLQGADRRREATIVAGNGGLSFFLVILYRRFYSSISLYSVCQKKRWTS
jgi:hypothetical protein